MKNPCKECSYYCKENSTCQSKKVATGSFGYVTFWDKLWCEPYKEEILDAYTDGEVHEVSDEVNR